MSEYESATGFRAPEPQQLAAMFPDYEIDSLVATGGMGAVYRAVQKSLDRVVAIKVLPTEFSTDPEFCASFEAEAKAMAKLNHPNLIGIYDFGEVGGMLFIVMEFISGQSLHDACLGHAVEPSEVIRLIKGISEGLAHAHEHGILHRDIKPANILLDDQLQPKIGDFGLARPVEKQVEEGEAIFGTPGYTAPEVLQPPHTVDPRADIFSLGVLMHELLTGRLPESDPRPPSAISHCDPRLDVVVRKATHPNPDMRYQSASLIGGELDKISRTRAPRALQTAGPTSAALPRPGQPAMAAPRKGGGGKWLLLLLLLAIGGAAYRYRDLYPGAGPTQPAAGPTQPTAEPTQPAATTAAPAATTAAAPPAAVVDAGPGETVNPAEDSLPPAPPVEDAPPVTVDPSPEPTQNAGADQPRFDVAGFLEHARAVMLDRCRETIGQQDELLEDNVSDFKWSIRRAWRENLSREWWDNAERNLRHEIDIIKDNGNRMPAKLSSDLYQKPWANALLEEHRRKESAIEDVINDGLKQEAKTYLHGLELRVPKLRKVGDQAAVDLLKKEIDQVILDPAYFPGLMRKAYEAE